MSVISDIAWTVFDLWNFPAFILMMAGHRLLNTWMHRWVRRLCPIALPAWFIGLVTGGHLAWWLWLLQICTPIFWLTAHRQLCRDNHGRKLRDAVNGVVHRVGNRLAVKPEPVAVSS